jgi:DNA-binding transcriptional MerR regulator
MMDNETLRFPWEDDAAAAPAPGEAAGAAAPHATPEPVADVEPATAVETAKPEPVADVEPAAAVETATPEPVADDEPATAVETAKLEPVADVEPAAAVETAKPAAPRAEPAASRRGEAGQRPLVRKEYYAISEVAEIVGLPAHVLRYWESQFAVLNPSKNRSGNRVYQRKEIRLILLVKQLLHDQKYTVEGARQKLEQLRRGGGLAEATAQALDEQLVQVLREELLHVQALLSVDD